MEDQELHIVFEHDVITLDIPDVVGQWKIAPLTSTQVTKMSYIQICGMQHLIVIFFLPDCPAVIFKLRNLQCDVAVDWW